MHEATIQDTPLKDIRNNPDRRVFTAMTAFKSLTLSRRKQHRRADESPHAQRDWYHPRLFVLVVGIMLMSIADSFFTLKLLSRGAIEANPVMDYFINLGVSTFILSKMIMTGCSVFVLTALSSYLIFDRFMISKVITICFIGYMILISYELILLSL